MDKRGLLAELTVGRRVAEEEVNELAAYFVETDQWRQVIKGEADIVFGPKGCGKSAIYASLLNRQNELSDRGILLVSAENPSGAAAFKGLVTDPPASEAEFVGLWKLYTASLVATVIVDYGLTSPAAEKFRSVMESAGLLPSSKATLSAVLSDVFGYVKQLLRPPKSFETTAHFDPSTGATTGLTAKVVLVEPSAEEKQTGVTSVDELFRLASEALETEDLSVWVLFDRLDVAFADAGALEANALRALFKVYLDIPSSSRVKLKLFLRSDIWQDITESGFRELSHIERSVTISWSERSLLALIVQRLLQNQALREAYGVEAPDVVASESKQRQFFNRLVPDQVDTGRNPKTFEWLLARVKDGNGVVAPRELIHLVSEARDQQIAMLETGQDPPGEEMLLSRQALREALPAVSKVRLNQTLFAEYPGMKPYLTMLAEEKTEQSAASLTEIWQVDESKAVEIANRLADIGFFERRGSKNEPRYWVPFLYRPALELVQGAAD